MSYTHGFSPTFFNGERCTVCGYQAQGATESETKPQNGEKEDSQRSSSVWVWATAGLVIAGGLGTAAFFMKKK